MSSVAQPLLAEAELLQLYQRAALLRSTTQPRQSERRQAGDVASRHRGAGLDYDQSRPYQPGDEPRFINWRLTARSGSPFIKQYREERRPGVFILVDRRSGMRFGTRVRLKVTQAVRLAALLAFAAGQQDAALAGVLLETPPRWLAPASGAAAAWQWVRQCVAACASAASPPDETSLATLLPVLDAQLASGTKLYLLSDFATLDAACEAPLAALAQRHAVFALHILDAAELALPEAGKLVLRDFAGVEVAADLADATLRAQFGERAAALHARTEQRLRTAGCGYLHLPSELDAVESALLAAGML